MNIYEKMSAITSELSAVAKNLQVGEGRSSYKAVGEADVLAAVKPLESKYKVYSYPVRRTIIDSDTFTVTKTYKDQTQETTKLFMRVETVYRFVNTESPEEYIDITTYGDGVDSNDKAPGKAMTYGDKYALLKAYKIITGDDPDQNPSGDDKIIRGKQSPKTRTYRCEDCGKELTPQSKKDGSVMPVDEYVDICLNQYGKPLCRDCRKKYAN